MATARAAGVTGAAAVEKVAAVTVAADWAAAAGVGGGGGDGEGEVAKVAAAAAVDVAAVVTVAAAGVMRGRRG